jgi:hypothetical protein
MTTATGPHMPSISSPSQQTSVPGVPQRPEHQPPADLTTDVQAVYHGWPRPDGTTAVVIESPPGNYKPLPHQIRHSPTGFNCGYNGNGPRDLALSLLTDALFTFSSKDVLATPPADKHAQAHDSISSNAAPINSTVAPATGRCDSRPPPLPYLRFAEQMVAQLPQDKEWTLSRQEITRWLTGS